MWTYGRIIAFWVALMATIVTSQNGIRSRPPPPDFRHPFEPKDSNKSIDQIITETLGGVDIASNMILADDNSNILAELDMYLTQDQFLSMYEPPKPEDMIKMGMMPIPEGAPAPSADEGYFYDFAEDHKGSGIRTKRKAVRHERLRWTDSSVPYTFATGHFDEKEEYMMRRSMTEWERYTCLNFRPATNADKNTLRFQNGVGCNSQLGMVGGVQVLNLQAPGCRFKGLYLHEIGHALGLVHEHQLPDRDNYIRILYHNVSPHMRIWFNKYTSKEVNQMTVPFEYSSVMHYGITAFAKDGKSQTIAALDKSKEDTIGKVYLKELAYSDVHIVNLMYNCSSHCTNPNRCGPNGHLDQNCNCICRDGSSDCDRTKQATNERCVNNYDSWSCYIWANQGECDRNAYYMNQQCAKACNMCGDKPDSQGGCKDVHSQEKCTVWKERGDCVTNQMWMKLNCKATCNLCGDITIRPEVNCENSYEEPEKCDGWAKDGECSVNAKWMYTHCRKSCELCQDDGTTTTTTDGGDGIDEEKIECKDTHHNCGSWARTGECESNSPWMISNCRQACGKCEDNTCKNLYDDVQCQIWADKGECMANSEWMARHCAKVCGRGLCEGQDPDVTDETSGTPDPRTRTTSRKTTPRGRTSTTTGSCYNRHSSDTECEIWAKNDHCNINPNWMRKNCAKACGECTSGGTDGRTTPKGTRTTTVGTGSGGEVCADRESGCLAWAKHGFCDSNPRYNLIFCKKSCNNCNGCRDVEFLCPVWAKDGHCEKNPRYMLRHCQKSCKACYKSYDDMEHLKPTTESEGGSDSGAQFLVTPFLIWLCLIFTHRVIV